MRGGDFSAQRWRPIQHRLFTLLRLIFEAVIDSWLIIDLVPTAISHARLCISLSARSIPACPSVPRPIHHRGCHQLFRTFLHTALARVPFYPRQTRISSHLASIHFHHITSTPLIGYRIVPPYLLLIKSKARCLRGENWSLSEMVPVERPVF